MQSDITFGKNSNGRICGALLTDATAVDAGSFDPDMAEGDSLVPVEPTSDFYDPVVYTLVRALRPCSPVDTCRLHHQTYLANGKLLCFRHPCPIPEAKHPAAFRLAQPRTSFCPMQESAAKPYTTATLTVSDAHGGDNECSAKVREALWNLRSFHHGPSRAVARSCVFLVRCVHPQHALRTVSHITLHL
jgi:hypothetical protein